MLRSIAFFVWGIIVFLSMAKSQSLHELKKELQLLSVPELADLCVSLAKYKKDNKEFLAYLLFQSHDNAVFVNDIKQEIDELFVAIDVQPNLYLAKKSLRKVLRLITKYCKYMNDKAISADLHIYFCNKVKQSGILFRKSQVLVNMYEQQLKKIHSFIATLHEDLQSDYAQELQNISKSAHD